MDMWQILGIPFTHDEKEIRRAYAKQLKKYRPDTHPKEYQQLREAFENAKNVSSYLLVILTKLHCTCSDNFLNLYSSHEF